MARLFNKKKDEPQPAPPQVEEDINPALQEFQETLDALEGNLIRCSAIVGKLRQFAA